MAAIDWCWHAGHPHYALHADGPMKGYVAVHVARPGGRLQGNIPRHDGPWVKLPVCDTLEELEALIVAWHDEHPHAPPPRPRERERRRWVPNRPEPARWPRGARRRR